MKMSSKNVFLKLAALALAVNSTVCFALPPRTPVVATAHHKGKVVWKVSKPPTFDFSIASVDLHLVTRPLQLTDYFSVYLCSTIPGCQLFALPPRTLVLDRSTITRHLISKWATLPGQPLTPTGTQYGGLASIESALRSHAAAAHSISTALDAQNAGSATLGAVAWGREEDPRDRMFAGTAAGDPLVWEGPASIYALSVSIVERSLRVAGSVIETEDVITTTHVGVADSEMGVFFSCTDGRLIEFSTPSNPLIGTADGRLHERSYQDPEDQPSFVIVREGGEPFEIPEGVACSLAINVATRAYTVVEESPGLPGPLEPFDW